jgi:anti-sigma B factor antagonist
MCGVLSAAFTRHPYGGAVLSDPFFSLVVRRSDAGTVVKVTGELDVATAPELEQALADADGQVMVDLSATTFADPAALRVLLAACADGARIRVLPRRGRQVARLLALTDTERLLSPA